MNLIKLIGGGKIYEDYLRWKALRKCGFLKSFLFYPEFRILMLHRMRCRSRVMRLLLKPFDIVNTHSLFITCQDIEGGLFLEHAFATIISCRHIGRNCWINQQVTIGYSDAVHCPYIGNDVHIKAGAKVIGNVTIGDDVIIGANAVVVKDVPPHSIVVGVPARVIKTRNSIDEEWKNV